jgi:Fe2+ or Zn2+ uptake regulation protein
MNKKDTICDSSLRSASKRSGIKLTSARQAVYDTLISNKQGLTIQEAAAELKPKGIGQATVYRTIAILEKINIIKCVHGREGLHKYVAWTNGHVHALVCRACGKASEFDACGLEVLEKLLKEQTGFQIEGHHLEIYGLCPECAHV